MKLKQISLSLLCYLFVQTSCLAVTRATFENEYIKVHVTSNAPEPLSAFYEGRGFRKDMIDIIRQQCFISIFIRNKSNGFVWLDLSKWHFENADGKITRLDRKYWKTLWQVMNIPLAHQSTFRWTLLPEKLDFHPGEKEGGNIILPRHGKPFSITARFDSGKDQTGKTIVMNLNNLTCKTDK